MLRLTYFIGDLYRIHADMDETRAEQMTWELAARLRGLIPQPHGGALMPGGGFRPGAGRPRSRFKLALAQVKGDPVRQMELARQFLRDKSLPVGEVIRAATFVLNLAIKLDRQACKNTQVSKRPTLRVIRGTPEVIAARVARVGERLDRTE